MRLSVKWQIVATRNCSDHLPTCKYPAMRSRENFVVCGQEENARLPIIQRPCIIASQKFRLIMSVWRPSAFSVKFRAHAQYSMSRICSSCTSLSLSCTHMNSRTYGCNRNPWSCGAKHGVERSSNSAARCSQGEEGERENIHVTQTPAAN